MNTVLWKANERGTTNIGWLRSHHGFSFGGYRNPNNMHFGRLRVFNDDSVAPGAGFGTHGHENMEIISIPLKGTIVHRDSLGHESPLRPGDVQAMSAGKGILHSEFNGSDTDDLEFLQIWIMPNTLGVAPRYAETTIGWPFPLGITPVVGPQDGSAPLTIHQDASLSIVRLSNGDNTELAIAPGRLGYVFLVEGSANIAGVDAEKRDAVGFVSNGATGLTAKGEAIAVIIDLPAE